MYIIAGLGNPGKKYENTRHNMGFHAVDRIAETLRIDVNRGRFQSLIGEGDLDGEKVILCKPQTFMNLSGNALREICSFYKLPMSHVIVIYDDIDLPLGHLRIRKAGGPGTHNGMRSVVQQLGTEDFPRIRIGVGGNKGSLVNHVIGAVPKEERVRLEEAAQAASDAALDIIRLGADRAMNLHNTKKGSKKNGESKDEK